MANQATEAYAFAQPWLDLQCRMIAGASHAVVALGEAGCGPFKPVAVWPADSTPAPGLAQVAQLALTEGRPVAQGAEAGEPESWRMAVPLRVGGERVGVAALEVSADNERSQRIALQLLHWSAASLEILLPEPRVSTVVDRGRDRLVTVLELVATAVAHESFRAAATAFVTELATRLSCERVSLGFRRRRQCHVVALSHSARFARKSNLIRGLGAAMDEALDQQATLLHPASADDHVTRAHAELAERHGSGGICTVPMRVGDELLGALTLELGSGGHFDAETVSLAEHVAALAGPLLELKQREDRWLVQKARDSVGAQLAKLLGAGHTTAKLFALVGSALLAVLVLVQGAYRVSANATLEGAVQRAVVAAMDGYVDTAHARFGDIVSEGQLLGTLEDRELQLERTRWLGQRQQLRKEYRAALASHDRSLVNILRAQLDQAAAQIQLLDEQMARTRMTAPFDGVVVSGDLSQALGSPVGRGDVLFEVAPLNAYRVILEVDEREITEVSVGQPGTLALSAMPGERLPLRVEKVTPVSSAEDGRNFFRVEARLEAVSDRLRPGMEGVGKIEIGQRRLLWIWGHELVDWLRLRLWTWWP